MYQIFRKSNLENLSREDGGAALNSPACHRATIHKLVAGLISSSSTIRVFDDEDSLAEIGLASLGMISLLLAVESAFDIEVPRADITPEAFHSVATVNALVSRLLSAVPAALACKPPPPLGDHASHATG